MAIKFSKEEITLMKSTIDGFKNSSDKKTMQGIITKMENMNKVYKSHTKVATERILEMRKDDKWYGRGAKVVQNHFNTVAKRIKNYLLTGKTKEARHQYELMKEEAKFPRHKLQFDNAVAEYLTSVDIEFLNRR